MLLNASECVGAHTDLWINALHRATLLFPLAPNGVGPKRYLSEISRNAIMYGMQM